MQCYQSNEHIFFLLQVIPVDRYEMDLFVSWKLRDSLAH